jgi:hypothetical protein
LSFEIRHSSQFQPIIPIALLWRGNPRCFIADGRQDLAVFRPGLGQDILFPTTTTPVAIGDKTDEEFSTLASMWPKASVAQIARAAEPIMLKYPTGQPGCAKRD